MNNREEILKKINFELEKLSDEELEKISGGDCWETADDSRFLNVLLHGSTKYHQCDRYGATRIWYTGDDGYPVSDIKKSWKSLGIDATLEDELIYKNKYFKDGREISRDEAWAHAENLVGKHLTKAQWNW